MQRLEVSGAVRPIKGSLGVKELNYLRARKLSLLLTNLTLPSFEVAVTACVKVWILVSYHIGRTQFDGNCTGVPKMQQVRGGRRNSETLQQKFIVIKIMESDIGGYVACTVVKFTEKSCCKSIRKKSSWATWPYIYIYICVCVCVCVCVGG
jgi:hypothetical protein